MYSPETVFFKNILTLLAILSMEKAMVFKVTTGRSVSIYACFFLLYCFIIFAVETL